MLNMDLRPCIGLRQLRGGTAIVLCRRPARETGEEVFFPYRLLHIFGRDSLHLGACT